MKKSTRIALDRFELNIFKSNPLEYVNHLITHSND